MEVGYFVYNFVAPNTLNFTGNVLAVERFLCYFKRPIQSFLFSWQFNTSEGLSCLFLTQLTMVIEMEF